MGGGGYIGCWEQARPSAQGYREHHLSVFHYGPESIFLAFHNKTDSRDDPGEDNP